jgi:zinc protease
LNQRLNSLRSQPENGLIGANMASEDNGEDLHAACLTVAPAQERWAPALRAAQKELRRFRDAGPTEIEVETAVESVRSHLRGAVTEAPNRTTANLADSLVELELKGEVLVEPRQALRAYDLAVEDLSVDDIRAGFEREWRGAGPLISAISSNPPSTQALRAAWVATENESALAAYADRTDAHWGYDFGPPGGVASRQAEPLGQFVRIRFQNGVVFNFKQTEFAKDSVQLVVRFGDGRKDIENRSYLSTALGGTLFALGGVGKHSFEDLQHITRLEAKPPAIRVGDDAFFIGDEVPTPNLSDQMKVLAAYMSDPAFRPSVDPLLHEAIEAAYRLARTTPALVASTALADTLAPGSGLTLPPKSAFDSLNNAMIAKLLKPAVTSDPLEVTLVGDIDEQAATRLMAATFGALPPRPVQPRPRTDTLYLRFPPTPPPLIQASHQGPNDKALVEAIWPLYVAVPARRREEYAITLLASVFRDELRRRVRGELGKSYAPNVSSHTPDLADQGYLSAMVETYPDDLGLLKDAMRAVAARLRNGDISPEQLEAARAPMLAENRQRLATNQWWADALSDSSNSDQALLDITTYADIVGSIRLEEVKKAAADWLTQEPVMVVVEPAKPAPEAKP